MATDDRLYDLEEAPDHRFLVYSSNNAYITPYAKDTHGGELMTEFNQRAALNALLKRECNLADYADMVVEAVNNAFGSSVEDPITGEVTKVGPGLNSFKNSILHDKANWHTTAYATGCRDAEDFNVALSSTEARITVAAGIALVYGYFIEATEEITILPVDAINNADVAEVAGNAGQNPESPCCTKFVKLAVQYTSSEIVKHDERLIPPINGVYQSASIVINDELPYGNELLLGTITRDSNGHILIVQNPFRTRMVPLDSVQGAENYNNLLSAVEDSHIYGVKYGETGGSDEGEVTNLIDIDKWLWIAFESNLGMLLRSLSTNAETAGNATDEPTRGVIVSDQIPYTADDPMVDNFNCLQRVDAKTGNSFARISWHQAQVPPKTGSDVVDHRALFLPYACSRLTGSSLIHEQKHPTADKTVMKPFYDVNVYPALNGLNGTDGLMTYQQLAMLELMYDDYVNRRQDGYARGRQYGPFLTITDARDWFERHKPTVHLGDYFWVINDTAEGGGTEATISSSGGYTMSNIVTDYGTVSGTVSGVAKQSQLTVPVSGTGEGTIESTQEKVSMSIDGEGKGTISATVSGTVTGTLDSFTQNVSARYSCRYKASFASGNRWRFAHAVMFDEEWVTGHFTTLSLANYQPGSLTITPAANDPVQMSDGTQITTTIYDNGYGQLITDIVLVHPMQLQVGTIDYNTGTISGLRTKSTAAMKYFSKDSSMKYTVLDAPGEYKEFVDNSATPQSILFAVESVERGFAVPATSSAFGVAKVGTGSELFDVVVDPNTQRLRITDATLNFIKNGGFKEQPDTLIPIDPNTDLTQYRYCIYPNGVTFQMSGKASDWRAALDTTGTLAHIKGDVTLDFSSLVEDGTYSDGLLLHLIDVDTLTLKGNNLKTTDHVPTDTCLFSVNHCKVNYPFFTNIGEWKYSSFISGGDTIELNLPWMMIPQVFTKAIDSTEADKGNSLSCRFASVTMGENGVCSAMLDVWVKYQGWEDYNGNIDRMWSSLGYVNFPPMFFEYSQEVEEEEVVVNEGETAPEVETRGPINQSTMVRIPDNLNLKISGTSGVHQGWDGNNSEFVPSGNFLVNMNWEYNGNPSTSKTKGGKVYLNLYMKNASADVKKQNFTNLRFRAPVQIIRLDNNSMSEFVSYEQLYGSVDTRL